MQIISEIKCNSTSFDTSPICFLRNVLPVQQPDISRAASRGKIKCVCFYETMTSCFQSPASLKWILEQSHINCSSQEQLFSLSAI